MASYRPFVIIELGEGAAQLASNERGWWLEYCQKRFDRRRVGFVQVNIFKTKLR